MARSKRQKKDAEKIVPPPPCGRFERAARRIWSFLSVMIWCILVVYAACSAFILYDYKILISNILLDNQLLRSYVERNNDRLARDIQHMDDAQKELRGKLGQLNRVSVTREAALKTQDSKLQNKVSALEAEAALLKKLVQFLQGSAEGAERQFSQLAREREEMSRQNALLSTYILDYMDEDAAKKAEKSLPFSHFYREEWTIKAKAAFDAVRIGDAHLVSVDGNGGVDTINLRKSSEVFLDGIQFISIEQYHIDNNQPDMITVFAPGLNDLEGNTLSIRSDEGIDTVYLDGCLAWDVEEEENGVKILKAKDVNEEIRTVKISGGAAVEILKHCDHRYLKRFSRIALRNYLRDAKSPQKPATEPTSRQEALKHPPHRFEPLQRKITAYRPDDATNITRYESWIAQTDFVQLKEALETLVTAMKKNILPTEFLHVVHSANLAKFRITPLEIDIEEEPTHIDGKITCAIKAGQVDRYQIFNGTQSDSTVSCSYGNQFFVTGDYADNIKDSWGDDIFATGRGSDVINAGWGQDIIILQRGWGQKTINKTCHGARLTDQAEIYKYSFSPPIPDVFGGIGLMFSGRAGTEGGLRIYSAVPNKPASRSGLKKNDIIVKIDEMPVSDMTFQQAIEKMRGQEGSPVTLTYLPEGMTVADMKKAVLVRESIDAKGYSRGRTQEKILTDYKPSYLYNNFLVFGAGVRQQDMVWRYEVNKKGKQELVLANVKYGDKIIFNSQPCFMLVYTEDGVAVSAPQYQ